MEAITVQDITCTWFFRMQFFFGPKGKEKQHTLIKWIPCYSIVGAAEGYAKTKRDRELTFFT